MFVGHYGVALAFKKADPRLSLGTLFLGALLVDILWNQRIADTRPLLNDPNHLACIAKFVVVPNIEHNSLAIYDGCCAIDNTSMPITDEVGGHNVRRGGEVDLTLQA